MACSDKTATIIQFSNFHGASVPPLEQDSTLHFDNMGLECTGCKKGTYRETEFYDDMDGALHCTNCNTRVYRYPLEKQAKQQDFAVENPDRSFTAEEAEQIESSFRCSYHGKAAQMPLFIIEKITKQMIAGEIDPSYLKDYFRLRSVNRDTMVGYLEVYLNQIANGKLSFADLRDWLSFLQEKK